MFACRPSLNVPADRLAELFIEKSGWRSCCQPERCAADLLALYAPRTGKRLELFSKVPMENVGKILINSPPKPAFLIHCQRPF